MFNKKRVETFEREKDINNIEIFDIPDDKKELILPTQDLKKAFYQMKASTMPPVAALNEKKEIIVSMREGQYIDESILKERRTVYVGSGTDIEYPILLGARNILMVDLGSSESFIAEIEERIKNISGKFEKTENGYSFEVDFGLGKEVVNLEIDSSWYGPTVGDVSESDYKKFDFPKNTGLVVGFASGGPLDRDPNLVTNLPSGSYIYDSYHLSDLEKKFDDYNENEFIPNHTRSKEEIIEAYNKLGFEYIETSKNILLRKI